MSSVPWWQGLAMGPHAQGQHTLSRQHHDGRGSEPQRTIDALVTECSSRPGKVRVPGYRARRCRVVCEPIGVMEQQIYSGLRERTFVQMRCPGNADLRARPASRPHSSTSGHLILICSLAVPLFAATLGALKNSGANPMQDGHQPDDGATGASSRQSYRRFRGRVLQSLEKDNRATWPVYRREVDDEIERRHPLHELRQHVVAMRERLYWRHGDDRGLRKEPTVEVRRALGIPDDVRLSYPLSARLLQSTAGAFIPPHLMLRIARRHLARVGSYHGRRLLFSAVLRRFFLAGRNLSLTEGLDFALRHLEGKVTHEQLKALEYKNVHWLRALHKLGRRSASELLKFFRGRHDSKDGYLKLARGHFGFKPPRRDQDRQLDRPVEVAATFHGYSMGSGTVSSLYVIWHRAEAAVGVAAVHPEHQFRCRSPRSSIAAL